MKPYLQFDGVITTTALPAQSRVEATLGQRGIWLFQQMKPGNSTHHEHYQVHLDGYLDILQLGFALREVVERHNALRTVFEERNGILYQTVLDEVTFHLPVINLTECVPGQLYRLMNDEIREDLARPFDLGDDSLFRFKVLQLNEYESILSVVAHGIILDRISLDVLMREAADVYSALVRGETPALSILPPQFGEYVEWLDEQLKNDGIKQSETYWLQHMYKPLPVLELPIDTVRPLEQTYEIAQLTLDLSADMTKQMFALCWQHNLDPQAVLLTIYFAWLERMTGEEDLIVGVPFDARDRESSAEQAAGFTTNTLPIRVSFAEANSFRELYDQVQARLSEAAEHRLYPFDLLVDKVDPVRDPSRSMIYSTIFQLLQAPDLEFAGLRSNVLESRRIASPYDISWNLLQQGDLLHLTVDYNRNLFTQESILNFIGHYEKLLLDFLADEDSLYRSTNILTNRDRRVYEEMNKTEAEYPLDKTIAHMFYDVAERFPAHVALSGGDRALTYAELDALTNRLANTLLDKGLQKGDFAAIVMDRSLETVISLLAIIKAGGVYVPIDPAYPEDWIRYVLGDNNAPFVLTTSPHREQIDDLLRDLPNVREVLYVDAPEAFAQATDAKPPVELTPTDLAYVIYTSGSTGRPKGTLIMHGGVVNLGVWARDHYGCNEEDRIIEFASFSFDASVLETWSALFWGGRLHMLTKEERMSVESFANAVERVQATAVMVLPTVFFKQLAAYLSDEDYAKLKTLKRIIPAGEAFPGEVARLWQRRFGLDITVGNGYGPTECTVYTTVYDIPDYIAEHQANIPIGKPLSNYQLYVLNEARQLCPINVPGEMYIASAGLAKGYLNQPEKTAEVFLPHFFSDDPDARLYKSGDIVKLLPDGNIEYVGRKDSQVKIRGFRIEIGEIEDHFAKQPIVREVAVIAKQLEGINTLIAYYTTTDGSTIPLEEIRDFLGASLPPFMVPEYIFHLERMPLTPSGKMNRKELAAREIEAATERAEYVAPESETEKLIASVWEEVLGADNISLLDNFFHLGGHSLKILKILVQLKPHFPTLSVQDFFQHQTLGELVRHLEQAPAVELEAVRPRTTAWEPKALNEHLFFPPTEYTGPIFEQPQAVLLTGSTGYLGAHVLHDLLHDTEARIYCLVRAADDKQATERIAETVRYYFNEETAALLPDRVIAFPGDLAEPELGLDPQTAAKLQEQVEAIVHCGADVRYFGDETYFYNVNARGTLDLINFARRKPGVRFHHVSTLSVPEELALGGQLNPITGEEADELFIDHVYANSKLQAEQLVMAAMQEGVPVTIYRAGNLTCRSEDGRFQRNMESNAFYRSLKAMLTLGASPNIRCFVDLTPIDYASRTLVHFTGRPDTVNRMIHLCNPQQIPHTALVQFLQSFGYRVTLMRPDKYRDWLFRESASLHEETVQLIVGQLEGEGLRDSDVYYGCQETQALLAETDIRCPQPDSLLLYKLVKHAVSLGYFPASQHWDFLDDDQFGDNSQYTELVLTAGRAQ